MFFKRFIICFTAILVLLSFSGCLFQSTRDRISSDLGIDAQHGKTVVESNNHGGFHGDGTTFIKLAFSNDDCLNSIKGNQDWNPMPLPNILETLLSRTSALFEDSVTLPSIQNGYWCFIDRHFESIDPQSYQNVLNRVSINITLGIYDTNSHSLYYIKIDT